MLLVLYLDTIEDSAVRLEEEVTSCSQDLFTLRKEEVVLGEVYGDFLEEILSSTEFEVEKSQRQELGNVVGVVENTFLRGLQKLGQVVLL